MHTVQLLLRPTAYECSELDRRFHAISHIHNVCVSHADKLLVRLEHDNEYQAWRKEYLSIPKESKEPLQNTGRSCLPSWQTAGRNWDCPRQALSPG